MLMFLVFYILSHAVQLASSFWLSDWSNNADKETERNKRLGMIYSIFIIFTLKQ